MNSALYYGSVRHQRYEPAKNGFDYDVSMLYLDLDEIEHVFSLHPWWSTKRFRPVQFRRSDYLEGSENLKTAVLDKVEQALSFRPNGRVCLLTNPRYFGYLINPISVYYCFDESDHLQAMVAEVTNTPWNRRVAYVLPCDTEQSKHHIRFDKGMHVSPFMPMNMEYDWYCSTPSQKLSLHIKNIQEGKIVFDAGIALKREPISASSLRNNFLRYPVMTLKVAAGIYWQALKLWLKSVPLHPYPKTAAESGRTNDY